jgi:hypothetical protein
MGVYIKGVTKQELKEIFGKACILYNSADLVDVETPHGRLIDAEVIKDSFMEKVQEGRLVFDDERYFPTVIEAEVE